MPTARARIAQVHGAAWHARCFLSGVNDRNAQQSSAASTEFYNEQKWCDHCKGYVRFLMSINHSYCIECGGRVRLFNGNDSRDFHDTVQRHKWQAS